MFKVVSLSDLMLKRGKSINPLSNPDKEFELYSIPAYENKTPEFLRGIEIGSSKQILVENDVLLSRIVPHIRRAWIVKPQSNRTLIGSGEWVVFRSEKADPGYLRNFLLSDVFHQQMMTTVRGVGGSLLRASPELIGKIEIPLPPLEVQKKIAAVLEKADTLRRKREEQIKRLDDLLQATFLDMFGDPVTNPKGWDMVKLSEISHKITDGVHAKPNYTTEGKPFISVVNITSGKIVFDNCKFVSEDDFKTFTKVNKPEYGDILYTKVGATYGIPAFVDVHDDFCLYVSVCLIKPNHNLINSRFLAESLRMPYIKRQADNRIKGIGVPDLHLNQIREFDICYPPKAFQQKFVDFCNKLEKNREQLKQQLDKQNNLFNSLMQRAFKGELNINE